ncbi:hypothetical protein [Burkholderia territorii]|uniref:hypothetical protein n=1 Tax=Burkholderia territorii TaxID=1503055 RepID=UPI0007583B03|nr:hypothetical protein [Burkholderia territorii]KVL50033.1 hypothetical protein WT00_18965 [Burkholderia territorii]
MSYFDDKYPKMPSFWWSLKVIVIGVLTGWVTHTDWYAIRRELSDITRSVFELIGWFLAWLALLVVFLLAPVSIAIYMIVVRRQQRRVCIVNRKRYLRDRLRIACKGYSWS